MKPRRRPTHHLDALHSPLGRWGFAVLAAFALLNNIIIPGLICTAIALYAWGKR